MVTPPSLWLHPTPWALLGLARSHFILWQAASQCGGFARVGVWRHSASAPARSPPHRIRDVGREAAAAARPARLTRAAGAMRGVGIWGTGEPAEDFPTTSDQPEGCPCKFFGLFYLSNIPIFDTIGALQVPLPPG